MIGSGFVFPLYVMSEDDARAGRGGVSYDTFDALAKHHGITYEIQYDFDYITHDTEDNSAEGNSTDSMTEVNVTCFPPYLYM